MASASIILDLIGRDRASGPIGDVGDSAEKTGGKLGKLKGFAAAGATAFAAIGTAAIAGGAYVFDYGAKLQQMEMKAATVFGNQVGSVEAWADKTAHAMGLTTREATGLAAGFADLLIPMGFSRKEAAKMSTDVVGLAGALSQWSGGTKSAAEVTEILNAAMLGETDGLKALGISISAADIEARLLKKGQEDLAGAARQQAEAQAIQALIMEKSVDAQAAFAKGGSPLLSAQAKLKATFGEVRDELVAGLVPAVSKMADWFVTKGLPAAKQFGGFLSKNLGPVVADLGDWFRSKALPALRQFGQYVGTNLPPLIAKIKPVITDAVNTVRSVLGSLKSIFTSVLGALSALWKRFGGTITEFLRTSLANTITILRGAFTVIRGVFQTVAALLKGDWKGVWNGIKTILRGAVTVLKGVVSELWNRIKTVFKLGGQALKSIAKAAWSGVKALFVAGVNAQVSLIRSMPGKIVAVAGKMLSAGKSLGGKLIEGLKRGITGIPGVIGNIASAAFDKLKSLINSAIDKINGGIPNTLGKGPISINLPDNPIPRLARGGPVRKGQPYIVGDRGPRHAWELFVPDEDGRVEARVPSAGSARPMVAGAGGSAVVNRYEITINPPVGSNPAAIAKELERVMIAGQRALGRPFQFKTVGP